MQLISFLLQTLFWCFFIATPIITNTEEFTDKNFILQYTLKQLICLALFYANYFVFIPKVLKHKGLTVYLILIFITLIIAFILSNFIEVVFIRPKNAPFFVIFGLISLIQVYAISTTFRLIIDYFNQLKTQHQLEKENRASELSFLRSQINPHFLFNSLNNINALIRLKPTEAEKSIGVLSDLMRYILKSGTLEKIELKKEIDYLNNYIELQKLRLPNDFKLHFECLIENENVMIEPLLLIGFIENTFKHGVSGSEEDFIDINITCKNNTLNLTTTNKIYQLGNIEQIASGVGLNNTQKRLKLCYKNNYHFNQYQENGNYKINLQINL